MSLLLQNTHLRIFIHYRINFALSLVSEIRGLVLAYVLNFCQRVYRVKFYTNFEMFFIYFFGEIDYMGRVKILRSCAKFLRYLIYSRNIIFYRAQRRGYALIFFEFDEKFHRRKLEILFYVLFSVEVND